MFGFGFKLWMFGRNLMLGGSSGGGGGGFAPSLDFSDDRNSQYAPLLITMSDWPVERSADLFDRLNLGAPDAKHS